MEVSGQHHSYSTLPPEQDLSVPIGYETGQAPEPVWTLQRREKSLGTAGNRTQAGHPDVRY
jgi:hypothetical protein